MLRGGDEYQHTSYIIHISFLCLSLSSLFFFCGSGFFTAHAQKRVLLLLPTYLPTIPTHTHPLLPIFPKTIIQTSFSEYISELYIYHISTRAMFDGRLFGFCLVSAREQGRVKVQPAGEGAIHTYNAYLKEGGFLGIIFHEEI